MRVALAVALAFSLSLAAVRATETPEPIQTDVFEPTPGTLDSATTPNSWGNEWGSESSVVTGRGVTPPVEGNSQSCVMLKADSIEIKTGKSPRPQSAEPMAYLICDNVSATTEGGATKLKCLNCRLTMPNGLVAKAGEIAFDSSTNVLTLTGSDESPVTVSVAGTTSKTAKLEMKFSPQAWPAPATVFPTIAAPAATYAAPVPSNPLPKR